jgi:hypothetical protein
MMAVLWACGGMGGAPCQPSAASSGSSFRCTTTITPPPHFHATYGDDEALIDLESLGVLAGYLPQRALRLVRLWARQHRDELRVDWDLARRDEALRQIKPLM